MVKVQFIDRNNIESCMTTHPYIINWKRGQIIEMSDEVAKILTRNTNFVVIEENKNKVRIIKEDK